MEPAPSAPKRGRPKSSTPEQRREYKRQWAQRKRVAVKRAAGKANGTVLKLPVPQATVDKIKAAFPGKTLTHAILEILRDVQIEPLPVGAAGRNQLCPCGSGKKSKRCCAAFGGARRF